MRIHHNAQATIGMMLLMPFVAYRVAKSSKYRA